MKNIILFTQPMTTKDKFLELLELALTEGVTDPMCGKLVSLAETFFGKQAAEAFENNLCEANGIVKLGRPEGWPYFADELTGATNLDCLVSPEKVELIAEKLKERPNTKPYILLGTYALLKADAMRHRLAGDITE